MAQQNEILDGQLNDLLSRRLGMRLGGPPSPTLSADIMPTLALEVDRPEWGFLKQEIPIAAASVSLGVAANTSTHRLRNPDNSGVIAVVELIRLIEVEAGAVNVFVGLSSSQLATANFFGQARDTRFLTAGGIAAGRFGVCLGSTSTADVTAGGLAVWRFNVADDWPCNIIIAPGGQNGELV